MRRPLREMASATRSMTLAICGSAAEMACGTLASSAFMIIAISSADLVSRSTEAVFCCSVPRRWMLSIIESISPQRHRDTEEHFVKHLDEHVRLERFYDGVVEPGADLLDGLVGGVGPSAIGEEDDGELLFRIAPQRCAGVAEMAERGQREMLAGTGGRRGPVPSEGARGSGLLA